MSARWASGTDRRLLADRRQSNRHAAAEPPHKEDTTTMRYENLGPVANPDGSPTQLTIAMLAGTGRSPVAFAADVAADPAVKYPPIATGDELAEDSEASTDWRFGMPEPELDTVVEL